VDETQWEAEMQLHDIGSAADGRLLEAALLLVGQSPPGERRFPMTLAGIQDLVDAVSSDKLMVNVSVVEDESHVRRDDFHLWIAPNGDGSLRLELVSGKQPGFKYDHVLNLWADGEVFGQNGKGEVDIDEIHAEQRRAEEFMAKHRP
jgi:hypothetical protein